MQYLHNYSKLESQQKGIPVLSFFTGAGFLDIAFIQAGFNPLWTNECNPYFVRGYAHGMTLLTGVETRISNITPIEHVGPNQIMLEAFGKGVRPELFGIIGGPPCPDFSVGGKNKGREGEKGKLSQVFINRIIEIQPTFFLMENVPGFMRTAKHKEFFLELISQLSKDYLIDYSIINALEAGVPQDRERLFVAGFHRKWIKSKTRKKNVPIIDNWFPWKDNLPFPNAKSMYSWPSVSPFRAEPPRPDGIPAELMVGSYINDTHVTENLPNGRDVLIPKSSKLFDIAEGDVSRKSFKRLHRWRYSPTAAYGNNEVHLHPFEPRRLTVREALRIQTVPDIYALPRSMPLTMKFKTISNGVPVKLGFVIAQSIKKVIVGGLLI
ncbi:DNA cytosine methyltransferase [Bacillus sp. 3255]|uniref:DNA cytosine methyltransferase n=1 Tax=Bacillus sp. 3255 TaxID=2817904 RepID=UPI00285AB70A|nr:DNA cytosine methyltransferase [Bacillus sp. 3255]MDR6884314.1 DNA (cytosine-5)-methyltransferase 1 [Bacillus sp. 3255]